MGIGIAILLLILAWRWRLRDLIKRVLIVFLVPILHLYFLNKATNPIAFQQWTFVIIGILSVLCLVKLFGWLKRIYSEHSF
jgi:hypothetical protein